MSSLTDREFAQFQRFIHTAAGISLANGKKALVSGRLAKRLTAYRLDSYGDYLRLLESGQAPQELQTAVDLLTTNETCFFREPKHFAFLTKQLRERGGTAAPFRVWSAASSTGEEAYSIAMLLEDHIPGRWEVLGSDISGRALDRARAAHYSMARIENLPPQYLQRFCLKGQGAQDGTFLIDELVRESVQFLQINLNTTLPAIGQFDVVFLRNVLIYFNLHTKRGVVSRVLNTIKPGGYLLIGHSDSLAQMDGSIRSVAPSIYRKLS